MPQARSNGAENPCEVPHQGFAGQNGWVSKVLALRARAWQALCMSRALSGEQKTLSMCFGGSAEVIPDNVLLIANALLGPDMTFKMVSWQSGGTRGTCEVWHALGAHSGDALTFGVVCAGLASVKEQG